MNEKKIADPLRNIWDIAVQYNDIRSSFQSQQKQLENACRPPEAATNFSYVGEARAIKDLFGGASVAKDLLGEARAIKKTHLAVVSNKFDGLFKPLPEMSNIFEDLLKPIPGMPNKIHNTLKHSEIIEKDSPLARLLSTNTILPVVSSLNFPNIIIPRPTDNSIVPPVHEERHTPPPETDSTIITDEVPIKKRIFIGHGHSDCWIELRDFIEKDLGLSHDEFNRVSTPGLSTLERLRQMKTEAGMAFLIMTAQNEYADGTLHASSNVIHEIGLFQGKLGFKKAIILLEEGCEEFSNIHGLGQIRFAKGNIKAAFQEIREVLERERIIL